MLHSLFEKEKSVKINSLIQDICKIKFKAQFYGLFINEMLSEGKQAKFKSLNPTTTVHYR